MSISKAAVIAFLISSVAAGGYIFGRNPQFEITLQMASSRASDAQLYFDVGHGINEDDSVHLRVEGKGIDHFESLSFPFAARRLYGVRFDPLTRDGTFAIRDVALRAYGRVLLRIAAENMIPNEQIESKRSIVGVGIVCVTKPTATDPHLSLHLASPVRLNRRLFNANVLLFLFLLPFLFALVVGVNVGIRHLERIPGLMATNAPRFSVGMLCILPWASLAPALWNGLSQNPLVYMAGITAKSQPGLLAGHIWLDPNVGFTTQALGGLSAYDWLHGTVPWWNPYTGAGLPLAAEMQPSSFFLPFVLLLHFANGVVFLKLLLEVLAGLSTYFFLRTLSLDNFAALCGGILFELSGTFSWISDAPVMPVAFLPLLMLGIELARRPSSRSFSRWGMLLISLSIGWSLLAGFPETAFLDGLLALMWAAAQLSEFSGQEKWKYALRVIAGGLGGLLLASPALLPFFEYQSLSAIKHVSTLDGLPNAVLATFVFPYIFGPIGEFGKFDPSGTVEHIWGGLGGYLGCASAYLAVLGLWGRKRRALRILLATWIAIFLARCVGVHWVGVLLNLVPGLELTVLVRYSAPSWEFAAAVLAAFALDDWRKSQKQRALQMLVCSLIFVVVSGLAILPSSGLIESMLSHTLQYRDWLRFSMFSAAVTVLFLAYALSQPTSFRRALLVGLVTTSYAVAACIVPTLSGVRDPVIDMAAIDFLRHGLGLQRFYTLGAIAPNYGAFFRIPSINHNAIPISDDWVKWIKSNLDAGLNSPIFVGNQPSPGENRIRQLKEHLTSYGEAGVKYIVAPAWIHACDGAPDRSKLQIPELKCVYRDDLLAILQMPRFAPYFEVTSGDCTIFNESRLSVETQCRSQAVLRRRELFYPGWSALQDDLQRPVQRDGAIFQSVELPPRKMKTVFSYSPSHWPWIEAAFGTGLLWLAILFIYGHANPAAGRNRDHLPRLLNQ